MDRYAAFATRREEASVSGTFTGAGSSAPTDVSSDCGVAVARTGTGTYTITRTGLLKNFVLKSFLVSAHQTSGHVALAPEFTSDSGGVTTFKLYTGGSATDLTGRADFQLTLGVK